MTERKLRLTRNDPSHDPVLKGVWISPYGELPSPPPSPPTPPAPPAPLELLPEPIAPVTETDEKWKALLEIANAVIDELRRDNPDVDHELLLQIVRNIVHGNLSVADIAAIYRHRVRDGDHGR
jgi:hypothetical protein